MLSNTLRLNFCYLKIIHILHSHYHPKIIIYILKNKQKDKSVCIHDYTINRNENEDENDISNIYDINLSTRKNRPRSRHGHKYSR